MLCLTFSTQPTPRLASYFQKTVRWSNVESMLFCGLRHWPNIGHCVIVSSITCFSGWPIFGSTLIKHVTLTYNLDAYILGLTIELHYGPTQLILCQRCTHRGPTHWISVWIWWSVFSYEHSIYSYYFIPFTINIVLYLCFNLPAGYYFKSLIFKLNELINKCNNAWLESVLSNTLVLTRPNSSCPSDNETYIHLHANTSL